MDGPAKRAKSPCKYPGCARLGRSYKLSYCAAHYEDLRRHRGNDEHDAAVAADGKVPRYIRVARRAIMREMLRAFRVREFARRGHL